MDYARNDEKGVFVVSSGLLIVTTIWIGEHQDACRLENTITSYKKDIRKKLVDKNLDIY